QGQSIVQTHAPADGAAYVGPSGAGHYAKMVHNGIEYSMLQSYAEGFEILKAAPFNFDLVQLARLWNHGSVIRSWLLELAQAAFERDPQLAHIKGYVEDSRVPRGVVDLIVAAHLHAHELVTALYYLALSRSVPSRFSVIGAADTALTEDEYRAHMEQAVQKYSRSQPVDRAVWQSLAER